jgi:hypothetical protein
MSTEPDVGTFEEAQWLHLRQGLALTAIERLRSAGFSIELARQSVFANSPG